MPASPASAALAAGLALLLVGCGAVHASDAAAEKARDLDRVLTDAGLASVDEDTAATLFGTDGGRVCAAAEDGEDGLARANVLVGNAYRGHLRADVRGTDADFVGAVISVYCPDALPALDSYTDSLDVDESR